MNRRPLVGLLVAETISNLGSRMTMVALPWLVLVTTGSAARTGLVAAVEILPYVLASALGAPVTDRVGGRRVSVVADAASVVVVGAVPLLAATGDLGFGALLALVLVAGGLRGFGDAAKRGAMFPQSVAASGMEMTRAVSLHDGLSRAAGLLAAPLAGAIVVAFGGTTSARGALAVLLVDAVSFGVCALLVAFLVRTRPVESQAREPYGAALRAGLAFVRSDRLILGLLLMVSFTNLLDHATGAVLVPLWARDVFGSPLGIGLVSAAFAAGAVLGNIVFTYLAPRLPRWAPYTLGFLVCGAPRYVVLAFDGGAWSVGAVSFVGGLGAAALNPILGAVFYERIPERLMARVQGLSTAVAFAGMPLGALLGGWLGEYGARVALLVVGAMYLAATLAPLFGRFWREMDVRPAPRVPVPREPAPVEALV
ncbi:MFS transporter [Luedemannella flava]|uniref:Multidrug efflux pump Tap n=1 Tax=Luedemannella flava TaxID=349316 RepID=A0ABP4YVB8_9ACTN